MTPRNHRDAVQDHRDAGFTILEMVVASVVLSTLATLVTQLVISGQSAHRYANRIGRVTDVTQRLMDDVKTDLRAAVRIFGNDTLGLSYRSRLETWLGFTPIGSSKLPTIAPTGGFRKDVAGSERTGNELLFARHAWSDSFLCTSGKTYRVDIYRLEHWFLTVEGSGPNTTGGGLNFCKWTSEPLANSGQVDLIEDATDRSEVLVHLLTATPDVENREHDRVSVLWKFGEDPAVVGTLRHIQLDGSLSDTPQSPRKSTWEFEQAEHLSIPGVLFPNRHSIARNRSQFNHGVGKFSIKSDTAGSGAGFPHGLEFQVIGSPNSRQIMVHVTTISTNNDGLKAHFDVQVIMNVREG
jgi:prepilin-type N-terminal cleavage/methylation domain-containing protein